MKKILSLLLITSLLLVSVMGFSSCVSDKGNSGNQGDITGNTGSGGEHTHIDEDYDDNCDICSQSLLVVIDFYAINDLHGKFCDSGNQPGVDELASYLKAMRESDDNAVFLASGDMWQGTAESNLSGGLIVTEWMNQMGFVSMTLGNHDFDWGEEAIRDNLEIAEFPFLAINVYDKDTGRLADYCTPSVMVECDGVKVGIIGAIGDCYSSISSDKVEGVEFKVGNELANLVKAESQALRQAGADLIVYSIHDGDGSSSVGNGSISASKLQSYYMPSLSNGVVDLVFEAHTHQYYTLSDSYGVYHIQAGGENYGISHVEIAVNSVNGNNTVTQIGVVRSYVYSNYDDDEETEALEDKYSEIIDSAYSVIGSTSKYYDDSVLEDKVAQLYLDVGVEKWGQDYDIVLGGGYLNTRSPYNLDYGTVTYAELLSLLPFDNNIVLCSISGSKLKNQFVYTSNSNYHNAYSEYGEDLIGNISDYETYYVVVDTYTALYKPNGLTIVEYYDYSTYARDLVAEAVRNGEL